MGFYVPDRDYEVIQIENEEKEALERGDTRKRKPRTPVYDLMENKYKIMRHDALDLSRSLEFSPAQIRNLGLDPLYEWIIAGENCEFTPKQDPMFHYSRILWSFEW